MNKQGTYVGVTYTPMTAYVLNRWARVWGIPNAIDPSKYHTTVLYSKRAVGQEHHVSLSETDVAKKSWKFSPKGFDIFGKEGEKILVMTISAPELEDMHRKLIDAGGTHDFPDYTPHVTLSYDCAGFDPKSIDRLPEIYLSPATVYTEPLDLDWTPTK